MVAVIDREQVGWLSPAPTWGQLGDLKQTETQNRFLRPSILRFASDEFMEELCALLAYFPERMSQWEAKFETWEQPMPKPAPVTTIELPSLTEPVSLRSTRLARAQIQRTGGLLKSGNGNGDGEAPAGKLKLYQPIQQRYYLVTASLVCRRTGFPDRRVDPGKQERVSFVVRRIVLGKDQTEPDDDARNWDEHAYVQTNSGYRWLQINHNENDSAERYIEGEERLGLFSLGFTETSGYPRRLYCGVIPVGHREGYLATRKEPASAGQGAQFESTAPDARLFLLQMQVTGPWRELVDQARSQIAAFDDEGILTQDILDAFADPPVTNPVPDPGTGIIKRAREQAQTVSWYILLDLERFLYNHLKPVWDVLVGIPGAGPLIGAKQDLYAWLDSITLNDGLKDELLATTTTGTVYTVPSTRTLWSALQAVSDQNVRKGLEDVETRFDRALARSDPNNEEWPGFFFPLADTGSAGPVPLEINGTDFAGETIDLDNTDNTFDAALETLVGRVEAALRTESAAVMPEVSLPDRDATDPGSAWFTIRCVYERPNCGPLEPTVVSAPSEPFEMASFFDPEAPARPARIPMPFDISTAGLRKFNKSTTLAVSDMLCGQLKRIRKLTLGDLVLSVLPWPFHKDLPSVGPTGSCERGAGNPIGMFCSLSIPIVTLCALILLIIMVALFDLFFRWLPYLFVCLPIPGLKGKRS